MVVVHCGREAFSSPRRSFNSSTNPPSCRASSGRLIQPGPASSHPAGALVTPDAIFCVSYHKFPVPNSTSSRRGFPSASRTKRFTFPANCARRLRSSFWSFTHCCKEEAIPALRFLSSNDLGGTAVFSASRILPRNVCWSSPLGGSTGRIAKPLRSPGTNMGARSKSMRNSVWQDEGSLQHFGSRHIPRL